MQAVRTASLVHAMPGRIRVRLDRPSRSPDFLQSLANALTNREGVRQVQVNPATGGLLLIYDPELLAIEDLYLAAKDAGLAIALPDDPPGRTVGGEPSPLADNINSAFSRVNDAVIGLTGGKADAKTLVPLGLATWSFRKIAASGANLASVPWYILLWYSFEMFTKYNLRRNPR